MGKLTGNYSSNPLLILFIIFEVKLKHFFELQILNTNMETREKGGVGQWLKGNVEVRKHFKKG